MSETTGRCPQCSGNMTLGTTSFCFRSHTEGAPVLVENIPALVCQQCGHATYTLAVAKEIDQVLDRRPPPTRTVTIPVYQLVDGRYQAPVHAASDRS